MAGAPIARLAGRRPRPDARLVRRGLGLGLRRGGRWLGDTIRAGLVDTTGLPRDTRALLAVGYAVVLVCLALVLLEELFPAWFESLPRRVSTTTPPSSWDLGAIGVASGVLEEGDESVWWIYPLMLASAGASILGWAFVLTGASDCGRRVFLPLLAVFGLGLLLVARQALVVPGAALPLRILVALLVLSAGGLYLATHRSARWRQQPLPELLGWLAAILLFLGSAFFLTARGDPNMSDKAELWGMYFALVSSLGAGLLGVPFSAYLGLEPIKLAVEVGRTTAHRLRRRFEGPVFLRLGLLLLAVPIAGAIRVATRETMESWGWWNEPMGLVAVGAVILPPFPFAAWALWRRWRGRWAEPQAILSVALAVGWAVWVAALVVAEFTRGQDFLGLALAAPGVIPPITLFVALFTYNVMTFGARFANREGRSAPRAGRALLYLGAALLMLGALLFVAAQRVGPDNEPNQSLPFSYDRATVYSLFLLGPFYFAWLAWRHAERLTEEESGSEEVVPEAAEQSAGAERPGVQSPIEA